MARVGFEARRARVAKRACGVVEGGTNQGRGDRPRHEVRIVEAAPKEEDKQEDIENMILRIMNLKDILRSQDCHQVDNHI